MFAGLLSSPSYKRHCQIQFSDCISCSGTSDNVLIQQMPYFVAQYYLSTVVSFLTFLSYQHTITQHTAVLINAAFIISYLVS